jgi:hypothetical protein
MMMRVMFAATVATGLALAPAVLAKDAVKPATPKHKTHRTAKAHNKTTRAVSVPGGQMNTSGHPLGEPYTMQKDEMTR